MPKRGFVYILASKRNGTLYTGVTSMLNQRHFQHQIKADKSSFTAKYNVNILVYYELFDRIDEAIAREKAIKKWNRAWKLEAIEKVNPEWKDMSAELVWDS